MNAAVRPALIAVLLASAVAGCYHEPPAMQGNRFDLGGSRRGLDPQILRANPGKIVATELAFARTAQEKGQWTAFAEFATDDAVMFVPERVSAQAWLKGRANPAQAVRWQPHQVWSSCDGSFAVTKGAWQRPDGSVGVFTTVWERQEDGEYRWVLDQGEVLEEPLSAPEMVQAKAGDCEGKPPAYVRADGGPESGTSEDRTLSWTTTTGDDGSRKLEVRLWDDGEWPVVLDLDFAAGG